MDSAENVYKLSECTLISPDTIRFKLDADINVDIFPFTYILGTAKNPDKVIYTSSFAVKYYKPNGILMEELNEDFVINSYTPGDLIEPQMTIASFKVFEPTRYTFTFSPKHTIF